MPRWKPIKILFLSAILVSLVLAGPGCLPFSKNSQDLQANVTLETVCTSETEGIDRLTLPEHAPGVRMALDIPYDRRNGTKPKFNSVDFYMPEHGACRPIVVFIHGGGWIGGDKSQVGVKPEAFVRAGYIFASVNYRLSPAVMHPEHTADVAKSLAFIHREAVKYGGDPTEIYLIGHSAGAHLTALVATDHRYLAASGLPLTIVRGVVLLDGAGYDMPLQMTMTGGPDFDQLYRMAFGLDRKLWEHASPITHVAKGKGIPPFLLFHLGPKQATGVQAQKFCDALKEAEVPYREFYVRKCSHVALNSRLGQPGDTPTDMTFKFFSDLRY
jgi:acetyl esterase/lipase